MLAPIDRYRGLLVERLTTRRGEMQMTNGVEAPRPEVTRSGTPRQRRKESATMAWSVIEDAAAKLKLSPTDLVEAIGYDRTTALHWRTKGKIPKAAGLAAEALVRRQGTGVGSTSVLFVKCTRKEQQVAIAALCAGMGVEWLELPL